MSVSIYVAARRELNPDDLELVALYNGLLERNFPLPDQLVIDLNDVLGKDLFIPGEPIIIPKGTRMIEVDLKGEGDVMYGDGMIIKRNQLPPGTIELRIYTEA